MDGATILPSVWDIFVKPHSCIRIEFDEVIPEHDERRRPTRTRSGRDIIIERDYSVSPPPSPPPRPPRLEDTDEDSTESETEIIDVDPPSEVVVVPDSYRKAVA